MCRIGPAQALIRYYTLMDFRDPGLIGTFVYHCHILSHEDKGMMAAIQVRPPICPIDHVPKRIFDQRLLRPERHPECECG